MTNATHVRGQVGSRALIMPTHTNHLSTTCLPHVRLETRLPDGTKFREGWSLGTRLGLAACSTFLGLDDVSFSENGNDQSDRLIFKIHMTNAPLST